MRSRFICRFRVVCVAASIGLFASSSALANATITISNGDGQNVGFNDPTPVSPVGGNNGTTLGEQRLIAFQFAADLWGQTINSGPTIVIRATWAPLTCDATTGVLGSAGTNGVQRDFLNAPRANTWYPTALANALAGMDLNGSSQEINATFNVNLGNPDCLPVAPWYLGLDNNHGNGTDLVTVLLHEFSHGLGFQTFTNLSTGALFSGSPGIYDHFLTDDTTGKTWVQMTNAERSASAVKSGNLSWSGPQVTFDVPNVLSLGVPRLVVNSPPAIAGNYQIGLAQFGPPPSSPGVTAALVATSPADGCSAITNAGAVSGRIAFIDRGNCFFVDKVKNAQNAGALAVVIGNVSNSPEADVPPGLGGNDPSIVIPSVGVNLVDANKIRGQIGSGINASLFRDLSSFAGSDTAGRALLYAPATVSSGSSVSHLDSIALPNQLMEPAISNDLTHSVTTPQDLTSSLLRDIGWTTTNGLPTPTWTPTVLNSSQVELKAWTVDGRTSAYVKLNFPDAGFRVANWGTPVRAGNNFSVDAVVERFTGVSIQAITNTAQIYDLGSLAVGNYNFTFKNSGTNVKTLAFTVNAPPLPANPIDGAREFVRWQYKDFLRREPDGPGWDHWTGEITECSDPAKRFPGETEPQCVERKRANTSAAFFLSPEFQNTGYFVLRVYRGSLGRMPHFGGSNPPDNVKDEFTRDAATVGQGIVVNDALDPAVINANKQSFVNQFVTRSEFQAIYNPLNNTQYVDRLFQTTGVTPTAGERQALINGLGSGTETRASVLFKVVDGTTTVTGGLLVFNTTYGKAFYDNLFNAAFVQMEYFGYLLRDPDDGGYAFWLGKLNQFGNWVDAQMVLAFIKSPEYRSRFGQP